MPREETVEPRERLRIVFEGLLTEESVEKLCWRHGISTCEFYRWREKIFHNADRLFDEDD